MKKTFIIIILLFITNNIMADTSFIPKVEIEYAYPFDHLVCPKIQDSAPVTDQMVKKIETIIPKFTLKWNKSNKTFWTEIYKLMNKNYPNREIKATLTLCSSFPGGIAYPFMINAWPFVTFDELPKYLFSNSR